MTTFNFLLPLLISQPVTFLVSIYGSSCYSSACTDLVSEPCMLRLLLSPRSTQTESALFLQILHSARSAWSLILQMERTLRKLHLAMRRPLSLFLLSSEATAPRTRPYRTYWSALPLQTDSLISPQLTLTLVLSPRALFLIRLPETEYSPHLQGSFEFAQAQLFFSLLLFFILPLLMQATHLRPDYTTLAGLNHKPFCKWFGLSQSA